MSEGRGAPARPDRDAASLRFLCIYGFPCNDSTSLLNSILLWYGAIRFLIPQFHEGHSSNVNNKVLLC